MLANTSVVIEKVVNQYLPNRSDVASIIEFIANFPKESWIYPGILKRRYQLSTKEVYELLFSLKNEQILENYYELTCPNCRKFVGEPITTFSEIPEYLECDSCDELIQGIENAVIIFKKVVE